MTNQRGTTIIEILAAVAIGSTMLIGLSEMIDTSLEDTKGQQASLHQARIAEAARKYISANYKALKDAAYDPAIVVAVSVTDLIDQNFLTAGFSLNNVYGQTTCILVSQPVPSSGKLEALVVTGGGDPIPDRNIGVIAAHSGEGGGYIAAATPATAQGSSWSVSTAAYQNVDCADAPGVPVLTGTAIDSGHLVSNLFYDGPGYTDFLYRYAVDGRPDLNKMHTPIKMTEDAIVSEGAACGTHAAIASDNARNLLRCGSNGLWTQLTPWKNPVADYAALGNLPADQKAAGDVRMILDQKRAFMYDGANWAALAVDQDGNLTIENNVNVGKDVNALSGWVNGMQVYGQNGVTGAHMFLETQRDAGQECRIPVMTPDGLEYWWDSGIIVKDWRGLTLSCLEYTPELAAAYPWIPAPSTGYAWTYQNGQFEP